MRDGAIVSDPNLALGKPVIGGTRLTVEFVSKNSAPVCRLPTFWLRTRV